MVLSGYFVYLYYSMDNALVDHYMNLSENSKTGIEIFEELINLDIKHKSEDFMNNGGIIYCFNNAIRSKIYYNKSCTNELKECIRSLAFITRNKINTYIIDTYFVPSQPIEYIKIMLHHSDYWDTDN